jgi:hypothetical protein
VSLAVRYAQAISSVAIVILSGCASVPMASLEEDATAKTFKVDPDKSRIYLYRNESMGSAVKIPVTLNGKMMGQTASKTYFVWNVAPGKQEISCIGENTEALAIDAKPGKAHYVWQEMKMGMWAARCALAEVDELVGKQAVNECKLAQSSAQ